MIVCGAVWMYGKPVIVIQKRYIDAVSAFHALDGKIYAYALKTRCASFWKA